jgi:hypothetical protein
MQALKWWGYDAFFRKVSVIQRPLIKLKLLICRTQRTSVITPFIFIRGFLSLCGAACGNAESNPII